MLDFTGVGGVGFALSTRKIALSTRSSRAMFSMWGPGESQKQSPWGTGLPPSAAEKKPAGVWAEKAGAWGTAATAEPQKAGAWAEPVAEPNTVLSAPLAVSQKPNTSLGAWAKPLPGSPPLAPTGGPAAESPPLSVSPPPPAEALVVRCTGLPFSATIDSVLDFFDELDLDDDAVHLTLEPLRLCVQRCLKRRRRVVCIANCSQSHASQPRLSRAGRMLLQHLRVRVGGATRECSVSPTQPHYLSKDAV